MTHHHLPFALTPAEISVFSAQDFDRHQPGTVLADFETLLKIVGEAGMPATATHLLPLSSLDLINRSLSHPIEMPLARPQQKSYPHIDGLYLLLRASGLAHITVVKKKPFLKLEPRHLSAWQSLNPAERYFALLEAWWARGTADILGDRGGWATAFQIRAQYLLTDLLAAGRRTYPGAKEADTLRYFPGLYNAALLQLFGLIDVDALPPAIGKGWLPGRIEITGWGRALAGSYLRHQKWALLQEVEPAGEDPVGCFFLPETDRYYRQWTGAIRSHFPAWTHDLGDVEPEFLPGPFVVKVSLGGDCWRRIALAGDTHLETFADAILAAFKFDNDHLYCFRYKDRFGRNAEIDDPRLSESENLPADAVRLGDLPLFEGTRITFLFDFGDQWEFDIEIERVDADLAVPKPRILEREGKVPRQYG